jgi:hypothetical protein
MEVEIGQVWECKGERFTIIDLFGEDFGAFQCLVLDGFGNYILINILT